MYQEEIDEMNKKPLQKPLETCGEFPVGLFIMEEKAKTDEKLPKRFHKFSMRSIFTIRFRKRYSRKNQKCIFNPYF